MLCPIRLRFRTRGAKSRYRTAYCGLCRRIDALHGLRGTLYAEL